MAQTGTNVHMQQLWGFASLWERRPARLASALLWMDVYGIMVHA